MAGLAAGGILLLWVCWRMWRELRVSAQEETQAEEALTNRDIDADGAIAGTAPRKTFAQAAMQIIIADVSMSLDNVLAVAGAARDQGERRTPGAGADDVLCDLCRVGRWGESGRSGRGGCALREVGGGGGIQDYDLACVFEHAGS